MSNMNINGPSWILWPVCAIFTIISIVLLAGHGAGLIAGYNTAGDEEKKQFNEKKMCRVMGAGMSVITVFLWIMAIGGEALPGWFHWLFTAVAVIDVAVILVLVNTVCKK